MSDYMPKCATCEHFESCIIQKHLTEMALILWNISKAEDKADRKTEPQTENPCDGCVCDDGKHLMYCMNCKGIAWKTEPPKVEDEPQTERSE